MSEFKVVGGPDFEVTRSGLTRALDYFAERGCCRLFVLSDPFLVSNGLAAQIDAINQDRFQIFIYSDFVGEPKLASVQDAMLAARAFNGDAVLGIGGGSGLDIAKIVKTCVNTGRDVADFVMQANPLPPLSSQVPSVMIPTTCSFIALK